MSKEKKDMFVSERTRGKAMVGRWSNRNSFSLLETNRASEPVG